MKDPNELLFSAMLPTTLLDDDNDDTQTNVVGKAIDNYELLEIIFNIGKTKFKEVYLNLINDIKNKSFKKQKMLCTNIIGRVENIYNFNFPEKINIYDYKDINLIYHFIEFLEYDNINFLVNIFKNLNVNVIVDKLDIFCNNNIKLLISTIEKYTYMMPDIFLNLFETLENNLLVDIILKMINKNKELISNEINLLKLGTKHE